MRNTHLSRIKWQMVVERGGVRRCKCDKCGENTPSDLHHIINKGRTQYNEEARAASECKELFALLCQECHIGSGNVHNPENAAELLRLNCLRYGWVNVKAAFSKVNDLLDYPLNMPFPTLTRDIPFMSASKGHKSPDSFLANEICLAIEAHGGGVPRITMIRDELKMSQADFEKGVAWAVKRELLDISDEGSVKIN